MTTPARPYVKTQKLVGVYRSPEDWAYNPDHYKVSYSVQPFSTAVTDKPSSTAVTDKSISTGVADKSYNTAVMDKSYNPAVTSQPSSTVVAGKPYITVMEGKTYITIKAGKPYNSAAAVQPNNSDQRVTPQVNATENRRITACKKLPRICVMAYFAFAMFAWGFLCLPFSIPAFIFMYKAFDDDEDKARCYGWLSCIFSTISFASFYAFIFGASRYIFFAPTNSSGIGGDGL